jgi:hypothetical protein
MDTGKGPSSAPAHTPEVSRPNSPDPGVNALAIRVQTGGGYGAMPTLQVLLKTSYSYIE